ncbi:MAG TPA: PspA/IM30 family protein [bacterium]|nr:PspA/IM30 family protein [bacterium]
MGILSRFINVVRANLNALLNRAEDPAKMLDQTLIDMEAAYAKAKEHVARSLADEKRLEKSLMDQQAEVQRWDERAMRAVQQGDDDLAKEALRRKKEHARMAAQYEHEHEAHATNVQRLKDSLHELEDKIEELRRKKNLLVSMQHRAEAQDQIYRTIEGIDSAGAVDTIDRMENKIQEMAALADARHELNHEFSGDRLEQRFAELDAAGTDVDSELLELKQRAQVEHKP